MPQPKKTTPARKPAAAKKPAAPARKPAAKRTTAAAAKPKAAVRSKAAAKPKAAATAKPKAAARKPAPKPRKPAAATASIPSTDDFTANLGALRERLVSTLTLTSDRLQETVDDAVRRGRMTRKDAEELLTQLVTAGRAQTEALLADVEQLLGRGGTSDAVLRTVDRARRKVGVGSFPILGYDELSAAQITKRIATLTPAQLRKVRDHERRHDARKSVLGAIERKLG